MLLTDFLDDKTMLSVLAQLTPSNHTANKPANNDTTVLVVCGQWNICYRTLYVSIEGWGGQGTISATYQLYQMIFTNMPQSQNLAQRRSWGGG